MHRELTGYCLSRIQSRSSSVVRGALLALVLPVVLGMTAAHGAERSAESVVNEVCANCHRHGEKGAPIIGNQKSWAGRRNLGLTKLGKSALEGIRNMPSHGGDASLSSIELELAITYMVNQSGGDWVEPMNKSAPGRARTGEQVVKEQCGACHLTGKDGAPRIGDRDAWVGRVREGLDKVVASGIHGRGAMPARGGLADLTDAEMRAAVIYMFNASIAGQKTQ